DRLSGRGFIAVIALHDDWPAYQEFTYFSGCQRAAGVVRVCNPTLDPREANGDRAKTAAGVKWMRCAAARGLSHAPKLPQRAAEPLLNLLHLSDRHGLSAHGAAGEAGEIKAFDAGQSQHIHVHGRYAVE